MGDIATMIEYLSGMPVAGSDGSLIMECGFIAFSLSVSSNCLSRLTGQPGPVRVYTRLNFTESGMNLYGFYDPAEREMFSTLTSVPKVGAKTALSILSVFEARELAYIIASGDAQALVKAGGVGKKLAESIVFTLKGRFGEDGANISAVIAGEGFDESRDEKSEAVLALTTLGFDRSQAVRAVSAVFKEGMRTQDIISAALARIGG